MPNTYPYKLAAIDIGSNAIRLLIAQPLVNAEQASAFKKLEFIRFPLRLGNDVFNYGRISYPAEEKFIKLMESFKLMLDLYEVDHYLAYATSAMREAANGEEIAQRTYYHFGLKIQIIDGNKEAETIGWAIQPYLDEGTCLHIDVGGGSTELNLYRQREQVASKSFQMGSVRKLQEADKLKVTREIENWLSDQLRSGKQTEICAIGTGGNINKLADLSEKKGPIYQPRDIKKSYQLVSNHSYEERINLLKLNADRADVIVPAAEIYLQVMEAARIQKILVPKTGLKEGIIMKLFQTIHGGQMGKSLKSYW